MIDAALHFSLVRDTLFTAVLILSASLVGAAELPKGVVAEKPAEGRFVETEQGFMVPYTETIPGTEQKIEFVPIPGGTFLLGSPETEADRNDDEGPQVKVELPPFWIAKYETTWGQYWPYMELNTVYTTRQVLQTMRTDEDTAEKVAEILKDKPLLAKSLDANVELVDGITAPTPLYSPGTTYISGEDPRQPAVTMTPYAAKQYTKWLSSMTTAEYRLPTEAEWEYAARAGSTTAYPWGDSADELDDYAWHTDNSDWESHKVGEKKPNKWGLFDMIGNVAEFAIDQHSEEGYKPSPAGPLKWEQAVNWATKSDARVARGGYFDSYPEEMRSASRMVTNDVDWKVEYPNLPKSPWWYSDDPSSGVGFRMVRSLKPLSPELKKKFWNIVEEDIAYDVANRLEEGRGKLGPAGPEFPKLRAELESDAVKSLLEE